MYITTSIQDCCDEEAVEVCFACGGNIKEGNLAWFRDESDGSLLPCHDNAPCVDDDMKVSNDAHDEIEETTIVAIPEGWDCQLCDGVTKCDICGPHDEGSLVGYDVDGRPIGG